jgi:hypothetical protein
MLGGKLSAQIDPLMDLAGKDYRIDQQGDGKTAPNIASSERNINALEVICRQALGETQVTDKPIDSIGSREESGLGIQRRFSRRVAVKCSMQRLPLDKGGLQGGFGRNSQPGVGCRSGNPPRRSATVVASVKASRAFTPSDGGDFQRQ